MIVLLALPRSGSTLTYQALIHALKPLYLSNLWNTFYSLPWFAGKVSAAMCGEHRSDFQSQHGFVEGLCGPAEGLRFWSYWFGCGLDGREIVAGDEGLQQWRRSYLRNVLAALTSAERPLVTGYLGHVLAVDRLRESFPEAVFVRLHRDPLSNAMSILRSRRAGGGAWFSTFPQECADVLGAGEHEQVASQVYWLNRRLDTLARDGRTIHVRYEALCQEPAREVEKVAMFCNSHGMDLRLRDALPASFAYKTAHPDQEIDARLLAESLWALEAQHGALQLG